MILGGLFFRKFLMADILVEINPLSRTQSLKLLVYLSFLPLPGGPWGSPSLKNNEQNCEGEKTCKQSSPTHQCIIIGTPGTQMKKVENRRKRDAIQMAIVITSEM